MVLGTHDLMLSTISKVSVDFGEDIGNRLKSWLKV